MRSRTLVLMLVLTVGLLAFWQLPAPAQQPTPATGDEAQLIGVLESDARLFDKAKACQQLAVIGTKKAVPALAKLLGSDQLSHYARYGLEPIPDPSVDEAFRAAAGKLEGGLLVGVINSIGIRRDAGAVGPLAKFLKNADPAVAAAAAGALGRIASPEAVRVLNEALRRAEPLRTAAADGCLTAADQLMANGKTTEATALCEAVERADLAEHLKIAALYGSFRARGSAGLSQVIECLGSDDKARFQVALRMCHELPDPKLTAALVAEFAKRKPAADASNARQVLLLSVLADRGDSAALPAVLEAAQNSPPEVRQAAVRALARLGDASAVPVLLKAAVETEGPLAEVAVDSLARLPGKPVDAALEAMLSKSESGRLLVVIDLVGRRGIASAVPALLKLAESDSQPVRTATLGALGRTVGLDQLPALVDRLVAPKTPDVGPAAMEALRKACMRMPDRDACAALLIDRMAEAPTSAKANLLDLLGVVGGAKALAGVSRSAAGPAENDVQDAATRVLGEWMSADAAPVLLGLAKTGNEKFRVRCLRGYIRIARQLDVPEAERVAMCREALAAASRDDEKKLVFEVLGRYPSGQSLALAVSFVENAALKGAASRAAVAIAEKIVNEQPAAVASAMREVTESVSAPEILRRAKALRRRANAKLPKN